MPVKRGEIYWVEFDPVKGSEQGGLRPALVVQNDLGNRYSPTTIVAAVTSRIKRAKLPTHVELPASLGNLAFDSVVLMEQLRTIDKARLLQHVCTLDGDTMRKINRAAEISLGLIDI